MQFDVDESQRNAAKSPHELFMVNLALFHLMLGPLAIVLLESPLALGVPMLFSSVIIAFTFYRARAAERGAPRFVALHWRLALRRYRVLGVGYLLTAALLGVGWLVASGAEGQAGREIVITIFSRFGVMPLILAVAVCFVLESSGIYQATRGELPDRIAQS